MVRKSATRSSTMPQLPFGSDAPDRATRLRTLGIRDSGGSPHTTRTIMLDELNALFAELPPDSSRAAYEKAITEANLLGKTSAMNREKTAKLLVSLYSLDSTNPVFRAMRRYWQSEPENDRLLAILAALVRDPVLLRSWQFVKSVPFGAATDAAAFSRYLQAFAPQLSPNSLRSLGQNVASSWEKSGHFRGKIRKVRTKPVATPATVALALFLGYLHGRRGLGLFGTVWTDVLELSEQELLTMAASASRQGLLHLLRAGDVIEVRFPGLLTDAEEELCREPA